MSSRAPLHLHDMTRCAQDELTRARWALHDLKEARDKQEAADEAAAAAAAATAAADAGERAAEVCVGDDDNHRGAAPARRDLARARLTHPPPPHPRYTHTPSHPVTPPLRSQVGVCVRVCAVTPRHTTSHPVTPQLRSQVGDEIAALQRSVEVGGE